MAAECGTVVDGRIYHPDVRFEQERLIIEVDGLAWHVTPDRFRGDRARDNDFLLANWRVLRFTWYDLNRQPHRVIRTIRAALDATITENGPAAT
jgi:very-short-patch-repair endonuclease